MPEFSSVAARDLTLVLNDGDDEGAMRVLSGMEGAVTDGLARPFLRVVMGRDDDDPDPVRWLGMRIGPEGPEPIDRVFDQIARARGARAIQIVGLLTKPEDEASAARLDTALEGMRIAVERLLGHGMLALQARVAVLGYGDPMVHERFFGSPEARNLVIIPLDRSDDSGTARPVERTDAAAFRDHGAIEVMTLCGLWSSVAHGPLADIPLTPAAGGAPQVQLVQSSVRFLRTPPIPARELVDVSRELPLPELFMPANDPARRVSDLYAEIRSEALDYRVEEPPSLRQFAVSPGRFIRMIGANVVDVVRELPRIIVLTVRGEVAVMSERLAQRALGDDSRMRVQLDEAVARTGDGAQDFDAESFADRVDSLLRRSELQLVDPVPGDIWTRLSGRLMGVLDGDPEAAQHRGAALGDAALLVTDRTVVTGGVPWDRVWTEGDRSAVGDAHGTGLRFDPPLELLTPQVKEGTDWVSDLFDLGVPVPASEGSRESPLDPDESWDDADLLAAEESADEYDESPLDEALVQLRTYRPPEVIDAPHHGLLLRVLTDLRRQRRAATMDVQRLVEMASQSSKQKPLPVKPWVPSFAVLGIALVLLVAATSDLGNRFATSTGWLLVARDGVFIVSSISIVFLALSVSTVLDRLPKGTKPVLLFTGGSVAAAGLLVFREGLRQMLSESALRSNVVAVLAGGLIAVAVIGATYQAYRSEDPLRRSAARILGALTLIYVFIAFASVQALDDSMLRGLSDENRAQVRGLLAFSGSVLFLTSVVSLVIKRFAAVRQFDRIVHERAWASERLVSALEARTRLAAAEWQWIGTATVLARLITYPFGRSEKQVSGPAAAVGDPEVLKGSRATLSLTNAGREAIDVKLRSILVSPSWLRQQYEILVVAYRQILARRTGSTVSDLQDRRPEQDSYAPLMEVFDDALLRGDRWEFARRVAAGEFDGQLARAADALDLEQVYGPLLAESGAMVLEEAESGGDTVRDFIHRILPVGTPRLPVGLTDVLFSGSDARRDMSSWVWWPEGLLGELPSSGWSVAPTRFVRERTSGALVVTAVRLDLSVPFRHDVCLVRASDRSQAAPTVAAN